MSGHTPGPWVAGRPDMATIVDGVDSKWVYDAADQYVAVASGRIEGPWSEVMANARLIAAAPDMLEALQTIENDAGQVPAWLWDKIRDAIAKATNENGPDEDTTPARA